MDPAARYQIQGVIAEGEYATILRARDQELGRDVAIKQIHEEYLHDPAQLERYWQEAQLLASLDHPYILTVYDIVRPRGWLILELMQGSIAQQLQGQPIDLDFLRVSLICGLHALRILGENNIVHGDVKPGNLLLDRANRVKLGDFGIARRLSGDDGSLVKGSTKYMAPEVVSDQFGPIGTHSDLYSLGFTAYELMCGSQFDNLFPGLDMYGGNRQMAWIMWHAALDRRLPEINRVLEGVPEDLVHVIQKLTEKDPARRYRTPEQALADLRTKAQLPGALPPVDPEAEAAAAAEAQAKEKSRRRLAYGAVAVSMLLSIGMLFLPSGASEKPVQPSNSGTIANEGILNHVDLKRGNFFLETPTGEELPGVAFNPETDRVFLDDKKVSLADLRRGDTIEIRRLKGEGGETILEVQALRDVASTTGKVASVDASQGMLSLNPDDAAEGAGPLRVDIPRTTQLFFNDAKKIAGQDVTLADVKVGDTVTVRHIPSEGRRRATSLAIQRLVPLSGTIAGIDAGERMLSIRPSGADSSSLPRELNLSDSCVITINGEPSHAGKEFTLADLRVGDQIDTEHHTKLVRINAERRLDHQGIVESVDPATKTLTVQLDGTEKPVTFRVNEETKISFTSDKRSLALSQIRANDSVAILHNSPNLQDALAKEITVTAKFDTQTWALLVGEQQYADTRLDPLSTTSSDAAAIKDVLLNERRVASENVVYLANPTRTNLEQAIRSISEKANTDSQLIFYFAGHAYLDSEDHAQLAPQDFDVEKMDETGVALEEVVKIMEGSSAKEKLLILDTCHPGSSQYAQQQPSSAELAESLRPRPGRPLSSSVTIMTSCGPGERGVKADDAKQGAFAQVLASGLSGDADVNGDGKVQANELFANVKSSLGEVAAQPQTPQLFLPDDTPERLDAKARQGVRELLSYLGQTQIDASQFQTLYDNLQPLAPTQPDFKLAAGLVLLKQGKTSFSTQMFESALALAPGSKVANQALAWQAFSKKNYTEGTEHLIKLLEGPKIVRSQQVDSYEQYLFTWAGELAAYLEQFVPDEGTALSKRIAEAITERGMVAEKLFADGQQAVLNRKKLLLEDFKLATTETQKNQLRFRAKLLTSYVQFNYEAAEAELSRQIEY